MRYVIPVFLILSACGHKHHWNVDSRAEKYVETFYQEGADRGVNPQHDDLILTFNDLPIEINGRCLLGADRTPFIQVSNQNWPNLDEVGKQDFIEHELGHCILKRKHRDELNSKGEKRSIMYYINVTDWYYIVHRDEYLDELFGIGDGPN